MVSIPGRLVITLSLLFSVAFISGCGSGLTNDGTLPVQNYEWLTGMLREGGFQVTTENNTFQFLNHVRNGNLFSVEARHLEADGERITVFEYPDAAAAEEEKSIISRDGYGFSSSGSGFGVQVEVEWVDPPHWYQKGRIIVLYNGLNPDLEILLTELLGTQFAGLGRKTLE